MKGWLAGFGGSAAIVAGVLLAAFATLAYVAFQDGASPSFATGPVGKVAIDGRTAERTTPITARPAAFVTTRRSNSTPAEQPRAHLRGTVGQPRAVDVPPRRHSGETAPVDGGGGSGHAPAGHSAPAGGLSSGSGSGNGSGGGGPPGEGTKSPPDLGQTVSGLGNDLGSGLGNTTQSLGNALGDNPLGNTVSQTGQELGNTVSDTGEALGNTVNGLTGVLGGH